MEHKNLALLDIVIMKDGKEIELVKDVEAESACRSDCKKADAVTLKEWLDYHGITNAAGYSAKVVAYSLSPELHSKAHLKMYFEECVDVAKLEQIIPSFQKLIDQVSPFIPAESKDNLTAYLTELKLQKNRLEESINCFLKALDKESQAELDEMKTLS